MSDAAARYRAPSRAEVLADVRAHHLAAVETVYRSVLSASIPADERERALKLIETLAALIEERPETSEAIVAEMYGRDRGAGAVPAVVRHVMAGTP